MTVVTHNRTCLFGELREGRLELSVIGRIVEEVWRDLPNHRDSVALDEYVIMPNHMHAILFLTAAAGDGGGKDTASCVATRAFGGLDPGSLPAIVRSFKAEATRRVRGILGKPLRLWQPNYYEHVIRDDEDLYNIRKYILNNPAQWELDKENPDHR